jgi:hypothetical protein
MISNAMRTLHLIPLLALLLLTSEVPWMAGAADNGLDIGRTLTRSTSHELPPSAEGFIQRWTILEPIRSTGLTDSAVRVAVEKEYFPNQLTLLPKDGDKVAYEGEELTWHSVDTKNYNVNLYHFAHALGKPTSNVLFWGVTVVNCPEEMADVRLAIGSNAASVWWVNGREVIGIYNDRQTVIDDGVSKRLTLKKGPNIIRCAVINAGGATDFCARFLDANDKPLTGYTVGVGRGISHFIGSEPVLGRSNAGHAPNAQHLAGVADVSGIAVAGDGRIPVQNANGRVGRDAD